MPKRPDVPPEKLPRIPAPSSTEPQEVVEDGRTLARRYLVDTVRLLAAVALAKDSEAPLHTRLVAGKEIVAIAGIPQSTPSLPPLPSLDGSDGRVGRG
jgi:hypothetical protein